jgi:hypothetical protein
MLDLELHLDHAHVSSAAHAIYRHNWRRDLWDHSNPQRIFAHEDEGGLLLASWPRGGRPAFPFPYSDEVWTGIEYEVAALLAYLGSVDEALDIVTAARARYTGERRNPWSEIECGNHYARGMSSYSLLLAFSGFRYSAPERFLGFQPLLQDGDFRSFFSVDSGWGVLSKGRAGDGGSAARIEVLSGRLTLARVSLPLPSAQSVSVGGVSVEVESTSGADSVDVVFDTPVVLEPSRSLDVVG